MVPRNMNTTVISAFVSLEGLRSVVSRTHTQDSEDAKEMGQWYGQRVLCTGVHVHLCSSCKSAMCGKLLQKCLNKFLLLHGETKEMGQWYRQRVLCTGAHVHLCVNPPCVANFFRSALIKLCCYIRVSAQNKKY